MLIRHIETNPKMTIPSNLLECFPQEQFYVVGHFSSRKSGSLSEMAYYQMTEFVEQVERTECRQNIHVICRIAQILQIWTLSNHSDQCLS